MLNTTPLSSHSTFADYASFLSKRFLTPHFGKGAKEVHLLFENPGQSTETTKHFEWQRRDDSAKVIVGHACDEVLEGRIIPSKWREDMVNCRNLVVFLGKYYMKHLSKQLQPGKTLILAGCLEGDKRDTSWNITRYSTPQPCPMYTSNAEETDTRIWLHCRHSNCNNVLILSPDTDVYHIGLTRNHQKDVIVRTIQPRKNKRENYY